MLRVQTGKAGPNRTDPQKLTMNITQGGFTGSALPSLPSHLEPIPCRASGMDYDPGMKHAVRSSCRTVLKRTPAKPPGLLSRVSIFDASEADDLP